ncbi:MAG TPA: MarR family transcriptional regulator [Solirubrobacteraceae bacterium]|nr:MarR family transcriptional regulator [Solirubrobacteraceae bacterium]
MATAAARADRALSDPELAAWRGLLRSHSALVKTLDAELEATHGLALTAYEVLHHLARADRGRLRMRELAESVLLSRSGLTRMVDRLERDGLVVRGLCEQDARGSFAVLTDAGRELYRRARPTHLAGVRRHFVDRFSAGELAQLTRFWQRLEEAR